MTKWEYARLESRETGVNVVFTHRKPWVGLSPDSFFETLRRLGDEGWELVSALPLAAEVVPAAGGQQDDKERPATGVTGAAGSPTVPAGAMSLHVGTDRWLLFKRPQPVEAETPNVGADMIKGIVGKQILKGRLPLP
jgi:hypothetical protein